MTINIELNYTLIGIGAFILAALFALFYRVFGRNKVAEGSIVSLLFFAPPIIGCTIVGLLSSALALWAPSWGQPALLLIPIGLSLVLPGGIVISALRD